MNLRGHIMPVIDLRERLHLPPRSGFLRRNRILRVPTLSGELGVVVDAVQRIAVLDESQRRDDATGTDAGADSRSGQGFAGPFWQVDGELLQELRLERLLNGEETLALGWEPERGQIDFNRLLEPNVGESEQP
jgi:chemotaxis signal transduction protein